MTEVISVRFKEGGKEYYFSPAGNIVKPGDKIIVMKAGKMAWEGKPEDFEEELL